MKSIFISCSQSHFEDVRTILTQSGARGITFWTELGGRGSVDGLPHYGDHTWPQLNSAIMTIVDDHLVDNILSKLHALDESAPQQGLRAFTWNIENSI